MTIEDFIDNNIIVDRFPVSGEVRPGGKHADCKVIINVSDEFYLGNSEEIMKQGMLSYYFPLGESSKDIGISSLYGVLQVLHQIYTWNPEWRVLLHCQAGKNRSPTVASAFHYMMTEKHEDKTVNKLVYNCLQKHLPEIKQTELFLKNCKYAFDHPEEFMGGMYDWVIKESKL